MKRPAVDSQVLMAAVCTHLMDGCHTKNIYKCVSVYSDPFFYIIILFSSYLSESNSLSQSCVQNIVFFFFLNPCYPDLSRPLCLSLNGPLFNLQSHRSGVNCTWGWFPRTKVLFTGTKWPLPCLLQLEHTQDKDSPDEAAIGSITRVCIQVLTCSHCLELF